jgi:hypothetical protein
MGLSCPRVPRKAQARRVGCSRPTLVVRSFRTGGWFAARSLTSANSILASLLSTFFLCPLSGAWRDCQKLLLSILWGASDRRHVGPKDRPPGVDSAHFQHASVPPDLPLRLHIGIVGVRHLRCRRPSRRVACHFHGMLGIWNPRGKLTDASRLSRSSSTHGSWSRRRSPLRCTTRSSS